MATLEKTSASKLTRDEFIFLILSFFVALILRELIVVRLFPDSINYLTFARNILSGIHHAGDVSFLVSFRRPPLYPHLIAFFSWGSHAPVLFAEVGRQISIVSGSLLVLPLYFLTRKMVNKDAAFFSVVLMVLLSEFVYYSGAVLTEALCTFHCASPRASAHSAEPIILQVRGTVPRHLRERAVLRVSAEKESPGLPTTEDGSRRFLQRVARIP